jgi:hypothetical protein
MSDRLPRLALTVGLALGVVACHTVATDAPRPAVLRDGREDLFGARTRRRQDAPATRGRLPSEVMRRPK